MKTIDLDVYGNPIEDCQPTVLTTVWHKSKYGTYLYNAKLTFKGIATLPTVRVTAKICTVADPKKNPTPSYQEFTAYLPFTVDEHGNITVCFNHKEILESVELNVWTKAKGKLRNYLVGYPINITWASGQKEYSILFPYHFYKTPCLISEPYVNELSMDEKVTVRIHQENARNRLRLSYRLFHPRFIVKSRTRLQNIYLHRKP